MQDWWLETVIRGVAGPRFSMSSYNTSLLCTVSWFMYSGKRSQAQALAHLHPGWRCDSVECFNRFKAEAGVRPSRSAEVAKPSVQKLKHFPGRDARNIQGQQQGAHQLAEISCSDSTLWTTWIPLEGS